MLVDRARCPAQKIEFRGLSNLICGQSVRRAKGIGESSGDGDAVRDFHAWDGHLDAKGVSHGKRRRLCGWEWVIQMDAMINERKVYSRVTVVVVE